MRITPIPQSDIGSDADLGQIAQLACQLRADSIRPSTAVGSGHPTSSLSAADLMAGLRHPPQVAHVAVRELPGSGLLDPAG